MNSEEYDIRMNSIGEEINSLNRQLIASNNASEERRCMIHDLSLENHILKDELKECNKEKFTLAGSYAKLVIKSESLRHDVLLLLQSYQFVSKYIESGNMQLLKKETGLLDNQVNKMINKIKKENE